MYYTFGFPGFCLLWRQHFVVSWFCSIHFRILARLKNFFFLKYFIDSKAEEYRFYIGLCYFGMIPNALRRTNETLRTSAITHDVTLLERCAWFQRSTNGQNIWRVKKNLKASALIRNINYIPSILSFRSNFLHLVQFQSLRFQKAQSINLQLNVRVPVAWETFVFSTPGGCREATARKRACFHGFSMDSKETGWETSSRYQLQHGRNSWRYRLKQATLQFLHQCTVKWPNYGYWIFFFKEWNEDDLAERLDLLKPAWPLIGRQQFKSLRKPAIHLTPKWPPF